MMHTANTCYRGPLSSLLQSLGIASAIDQERRGMLARAAEAASITVEGDCELFLELMERVRSRLAGDPEATFLGLAEAFTSRARDCNVHLTQQEVEIEVASEDGRSFRITAQGVPVEVLILVKSLCGRRPLQH
ncbi:hypothetical protein [Pyrodictium abyssi]|uniref:Uncharacterized protein n=1 Tax=Pyrodictium abyssi TaxID=54256 RepID=A0ABM8IVG2_9CREN|nr:hypothetical protein PABY_11110 [Pyrodictium abyssi]